MPVKYSREVRAFALGLMLGVGGAPYAPPAVRKIIIERFGDEISTKTLSNWKSDIEGQREKYNIPMEYIKEVIAAALEDTKLDREGSGGPNGRTLGGETGQSRPGEDGSGIREDISEEIVPVPAFSSLGEMVSYMEQRGFLVATSDHDLRSILDSKGFTLLRNGQLEVGPQILSMTPIELDFEAVGKQIAGNVVILWYWAVFRKLCEMKGDEIPDLAEYVTSCVVDAMTAPGREWQMGLIRGNLGGVLAG